MKKLLTIGMATYDDFDGVFFSIQALRLYQLHNILDQIEFIVIDNNPNGEHGKAVKEFIEKSVKGIYIPITNKVGTSIRNEIFKHATGEYTLCMDSHVMFEPTAIENLLNYYKKFPDTKNLIQGPLMMDNMKDVYTHFDPVWRGNMFGIWANNKEAYVLGEPFEINMMGLGMFSCKTSEWCGFNVNFKGFGGEEGYIHEKFRRAGGKCICIPQLKWNHRFKRPAGIPYPNTKEDRIHNYFVGWLEILQDPDHHFIKEIIEFFSTTVPEEKIHKILDEVLKYNILNDNLGPFFKNKIGKRGTAENFFIDNKLLNPNNKGTFIEVGASNGIALSNSFVLENTFGWTGVLIEGNDILFKELTVNRPNCTLVNSVVWDTDDSSVNFREITFDPTIPNSAHLDHSQVCDKVLDRFTKTKTTKTLTTILSNANTPSSIDIMVIDVEDGFYEVLKGMDFSKYKVNLLAVELKHTKNFHKAINLLCVNNFKLVGCNESGPDYFFTNNDRT